MRQVSLRRRSTGDHEQVAHRDLQWHAVIPGMYHLAENTHRHERSRPHEVPLHVLTESLAEVVLQLRAKDAVQRNWWEILQHHRPVTLDCDRIDAHRITTRDDD